MAPLLFLFWFLFLKGINNMEYLTKEELAKVINIINKLNEYVINDIDMKNKDKLSNLDSLIKFRLKLEKLYEDNDFSNVE